MTYTPRETCELWLKNGMQRHAGSWPLALAKAFMGGILLSLGGLFSLVIGGGLTELGILNPGIGKFLSAVVFPMGLIMITLQGADLVTSVMAVSLMTVVRRKAPWWTYPWSMFISTIGNFAGSLFTAGFLAFYSGIVSQPPYSTYVISYAESKVLTPTWGEIFARGVGCNFLVCVGVYQAYMATEVVSKIIAIHLPIFTFVALSYDHVAANMFSIPLSMMLGGDIPVGYYLWKSFIPSFIGNCVGAALLTFPLIYFHLMEHNKGPSIEESEASLTQTSLEDGKVSVV